MSMAYEAPFIQQQQPERHKVWNFYKIEDYRYYSAQIKKEGNYKNCRGSSYQRGHQRSTIHC